MTCQLVCGQDMSSRVGVAQVAEQFADELASREARECNLSAHVRITSCRRHESNYSGMLCRHRFFVNVLTGYGEQWLAR